MPRASFSDEETRTAIEDDNDITEEVLSSIVFNIFCVAFILARAFFLCLGAKLFNLGASSVSSPTEIKIKEDRTKKRRRSKARIISLWWAF